MSMQTCARFSAPLTILLAWLPAAAIAQVPAQAAAPGSCIANPSEGGGQPMRKLKVKVRASTSGTERVLLVKLVNKGKTPALGTQLTLVNADGEPIQPAQYSDNCVTVLPREPLMVTIRYPADAIDPASIRVEAWNTEPGLASIPDELAPAYLQPWQQQIYTPPAQTVKSATVVLPRR